MRYTAFLTSALVAATTLHAQSAVIRSAGQIEPAGTILYSVYVASRAQPLGDVAISSAIPPGMRFLENLDVPRAGRYEGVADNTVVWTLPEVAADTIVGPFTFRVKLDGARTSAPAALASTLIYQRPSPEVVQAPASSEALVPLADSGSVTFDQRGTLTSSGENGPVPAGGTGILFFVPEGAVAQRTTVTFTRREIDDAQMPAIDDTWWCAHFLATVEPQVQFAKPVAFVLPTRRAITPGLTVSSFSSSDLKDWKREGANRTSQPGFGSGGGFGFGGGCFSSFGQLGCSGFSQFGGGFGGFGINRTDRAVSTINGATLSSQLGTSVTAAGITDGTSNTIIAILIGRR